MEIISAQQVAKRYNVKPREVLYAARKGLLGGKKMGWVWTFDPKELPKKWPIKKRKRVIKK